MVAACKLSDVNPVAYIAETLQAILNGHPQSRVEELMPWNFRKASSPKGAYRRIPPSVLRGRRTESPHHALRRSARCDGEKKAPLPKPHWPAIGAERCFLSPKTQQNILFSAHLRPFQPNISIGSG
ncbi:MAG: transposase domain-containing protein [Mesorhizobium sp.]|nr:MAG: transposase domain-containing protein [Mesorhizobium sp.]RWI44307.1 MAG: transposase domain-containing protein [Mesorhizobium sp.]RWJ25271.1 MAG: transposase domain-containing protein [Mesorhizobium sp.]RWJ89688.1 MAG: transposase domain-containing protein [Mesorhizobium sp.]RWK15057.1 MAG: transposase domain-containing protein [Mesorhizobium sp.]